ncbi:hypothetical protein RQP46_004041 [Phenoliferia psychrophenolica]
MGIEIFTTGMLCLTVLFTAADKSKVTFMAPLAVGLAVFLGVLSSTGTTGSSMNPARTFGPEVINRHFPSNCWVYYVGTTLGAIGASVIYIAFKHFDYIDAVRGIETDDPMSSQDHTKAPLLTSMRYSSWTSTDKKYPQDIRLEVAPASAESSWRAER